MNKYQVDTCTQITGLTSNNGIFVQALIKNKTLNILKIVTIRNFFLLLIHEVFNFEIYY